MKRNRKWLFLAALFVLALPLIFTGNAMAYSTHVDGATINTVGGWDLPETGTCQNAVDLGDSSQKTRQSCASIGFPNYTTSAACSSAPNFNWRSACTIAAGSMGACTTAGGNWWDTTALDGVGGGTTCTAALDDVSNNSTNCTAAGGTYASQCGSAITWTGTYDGNDACLRCHNRATQYNGAPLRWKDEYLLTGHRNMLREVTAGVPLGSAVHTAEGTPSHSMYSGGGSTPYAGIDWVNANLDGEAAGTLLGIYGGWYRNAVEARIGMVTEVAATVRDIEVGDGSYCGAYCHAVGPNAFDAPAGFFAGDTGISGTSFVATGVQCTRCHDHSADGVSSDTDWIADYEAGPSRHHDDTPEGVRQTELCYECHEQSGVEAYEVRVSPSSFIGHYRTNQFLNSPHARFEGSNIADESFYDTHFDGGCSTCHNVHKGSADPANDGDDHLYSRCGIECHNPASPWSGGGYSGFHDYFGGPAPNTISTSDNCSVRNETEQTDYTNQVDCEANSGYWNTAGTAGNNPTACVMCHMQGGTNHLWRINTDPTYTPFGAGPTGPTEADANGYTGAVWNSVEMVCGQCHTAGDSYGHTGTKLDIYTLATYAEDYHGHAAADELTSTCQTSGDPCSDDADCTADVCSRTMSIVCTEDADCPVNETCGTANEICQTFSPDATGTAAYARFNWYFGQGNDCYEVFVDGTDNGSSCSWSTDDGGATFDPGASSCVTKITFSTEGAHLVTLTTGGGTRSMVVDARGKMQAVADWTLETTSMDGMTWQVTDGSTAATCANPGGEDPVMHVLWGDGTTTVVQQATGTTIAPHTYKVPGIYTVSYCIKTTEDDQNCVTPVTINVPADSETCNVTGNIAGVVINYGTEITLWEDDDDDINTPNSIIKRAYTDTNGDFDIPNVQGGRLYRVVPSRNGYSFAEAGTNNHTYSIMLDCSLADADGGPDGHDFDATATW